MTENELLALALASADRLQRFALSLCGDADAAEDLVQEAFVQALARRTQLRDDSRARPWLFAIVRNAFLEKQRRTKHRERLTEESATAAESQIGNLEEEVLRGALSDEVAVALASLPEEWRTCLLLCELDECSYEEIAQIVDCPVGTVRSRIARARLRLLESLHTFATERGLGQGGRR